MTSVYAGRVTKPSVSRKSGNWHHIVDGEHVYGGLYRTGGKRRMSQIIEDLVRSYSLDAVLDGYQAEAAAKAREKESVE